MRHFKRAPVISGMLAVPGFIWLAIACVTLVLFSSSSTMAVDQTDRLQAETNLGDGAAAAGGIIAFISNRGASSDARNLYVMNADGSGVRRVLQSSYPLYDPALSPDGTKIAFNLQNHIHLINVDGSGLINLSGTGTRMEGGPTWSPDGQKLAFSSLVSFLEGGEIYAMNADGTNQTNLTNTANNEYSPNWSPDGAKIVYVRDYEIWVMNADGSDPTQLTFNSSLEAFPVWSPDGDQIAFCKVVNNSYYDIMVMNADGTGVKNLTNYAGVDCDPTWSPDGTMIAFMTNRSSPGLAENFEIFAMNADGTGLVNLTQHPAHDESPSWSQPSSPLTYSLAGRVVDGSGVAIASVNICTTPGTCVATNSAGDYSFSNLPAGSYTLTATKSGYTFTPPSRVATVPPNATGVNFTGTASTYSISGRVQNQAGAAIVGVNVCAQNGLCATTNSAGDYSFSNMPAGSYTLTATKSGYTFTPASRAVTLPPSKTGVNFTGTQSSSLDLGFRPDPDGFQFSNGLFGKIRGRITLEDWRYMFGDAAVCWPLTSGSTCIELPNSLALRFVLNNKLGDIGGRCSSMAAASLMLFKEIGSHETRNQPSDFGGAQTTYRIKSENVDIRSYIDMIAWRHQYDPVRSFLKDNQLKPSEVLEAIRAGILNNDPVVLFVRQSQAATDLHALVPYLIEDKGNGLYWVHVYDPNRPAPDTPQYGNYPLKINTAQETWEWVLWYYEAGPEVWRGDENSHTLQHIPISLWTQRPPRCPWCLTEGRTEEPETYTVIGTGPGYLRIGDDEGEIGFDDGEFVNDMPGASADFLIGGLGDNGDPIYQIPIRDNAEENTYSVSFEPNEGGFANDEPRSVTFMGPGQGFSVENIVAPHDMSASLFWVSPTADWLNILANHPQEVRLKFYKQTNEHSTLYEFSGVDIGAPNIVSAGYSSERSQLTLSNKEAGEGLYDLLIYSVSAAGLDRFRHDHVRIGSGDTHVIDVSNWQEDRYVTVSIDNDSDGIIDEEQKLHDSVSGIVQMPVIFNSSSNQPPPTNLALNRPAFATSDQPPYFITEYGNDGDHGTRWSSTSGQWGEWWMVDLGSTRAFNQVKINWEAAYATSYAVRWSNGPNCADPQGYVTGNLYGAESDGWITHNVGTRTARCVAVEMMSVAPGLGNYSFWELGVYNVGGLLASPSGTSEIDGTQP